MFVSNQVVLRSLSPSIIGVAAQLELFLLSILYFSRESIRAAIQRQPLQLPSASLVDSDTNKARSDEEQERLKAQAAASQTIVNISYLSIVMGLATATVFAVFYVRLASQEVLETPCYQMSVKITAIASIIELCSEPIFAVVQRSLLYGKRAAVEVSAAFLKSLVTCGTSMWALHYDQRLGSLPFAFGYLSYALMVFGGYCYVAARRYNDWHFSLILSQIGPR